MKIAVALDGGSVSQHFGHCDGFQVVNTENGEIKSNDFLANPGHKPGFLPKFLAEEGVKVIVSGGMGAAAQTIFNEYGIEVVTGADGEIDEVVNEYIKGSLKSTGSVCEEHQHSGECGE